MEVDQPWYKEYLLYNLKEVSFPCNVIDCIGFGDCCIYSDFEDVDTWVHEFTEMYLWQYPYMRCDISLTNIHSVSVAHALISFFTYSYHNGKKISPEYFFNLFFTHKSIEDNIKKIIKENNSEYKNQFHEIEFSVKGKVKRFETI